MNMPGICREYVGNMPIIDYHCHIDPREIYEDRRFDNITQVWLGADHYKWRQMRSNGIEELSDFNCSMISNNDTNGRK